MITREQIQLAKVQWEQARQSALLAHECWDLLIKSRKALLKTYRQAGFPFSNATQEFETLMEEHSKRYKEALEHMDNMAEHHNELLKQLEDANS